VSETDNQIFQRLLDERLADPGRAEAVDEELRRRFETEAAVMMTDSSGFTRKTRNQGIIHVLSLLKMHGDLLGAVIEAHGGTLLKREADNLFALFDEAEKALVAGRAMMAALRDYNRSADPDNRVQIGMGIGWGPVLRLPRDAFGDQVNQASKLGEDTAKKGEILITEAAYAKLRKDNDFEICETTPAEGVTLRYYRFIEKSGESS
jgi:class 3 adenylate cyclase